jgi:hypothetical protein
MVGMNVQVVQVHATKKKVGKKYLESKLCKDELHESGAVRGVYDVARLQAPVARVVEAVAVNRLRAVVLHRLHHKVGSCLAETKPSDFFLLFGEAAAAVAYLRCKTRLRSSCASSPFLSPHL